MVWEVSEAKLGMVNDNIEWSATSVSSPREHGEDGQEGHIYNE